MTENASEMIAAFRETASEAFDEANPELVTKRPKTQTESDCEVVRTTEDSLPTVSDDLFETSQQPNLGWPKTAYLNV